jgi:hypothetical protein
MGNKEQFECIKDKLAAVLKAQKKAENKSFYNQCDYFIEQLVSRKSSMKNTIPFILYKDSEPFKATGFRTSHTNSCSDTLVCVNTFIFKIVDIKEKCAVLELLEFKPYPGMKPTGVPTKTFDKLPSACFQGEGEHIKDLQGTGICLTVDLDCFCAITLLPPVYIKC